MCFPPPNDATICQDCDNKDGPFCGAGMGCAMAKCAKYCCDDGDCGASGASCVKGNWPGVDVGICQ
jgi:hypothetical protein